MAYSTQSDLEFAVGGTDRLIQLADWDSDGTADAAVVAKAIAKADGEIDSYLRVRYATPVATPSQTLITLSAEWAIYLLRKARNMVSEANEAEHKQQIEIAGALRDGKIRPDEPLPAASTAVRPSWRERDQDGEGMSRNGLKGAW